MMISSELKVFGTLSEVTILGAEHYYKLVVGKSRDGQVRQVCTRGEGRERGATRIPIALETKIARELVRMERGARSDDFLRVMEGSGRVIPIDRFGVLLIQMPREGNKVSGWEWNAPGGTGEPGETPEQIAQRELDEEADLTVLFTGALVPPWMQYASGCYDEVQTVSFALVTGKPTRLVEGARRWISIPLGRFVRWACRQNQRDDSFQWETEEFIPVDGKVLENVWILTEHLLRRRATRVQYHPSEDQGDLGGCNTVTYEDGLTVDVPNLEDWHKEWQK